MFQAQELTTLSSMISPILENTYYQSSKVQVKGSLAYRSGIVSLINLANRPKVHIASIIAPGPGTYRLPSDFGQYDQVRYRGGQKSMA
jgi:hypothetical protein